MSVSFPKPLTDKEEKYYISLWEKGDEKAKDVLIERNLRLVAHIAKKYTSNVYTMDDFISIGTIGLIKAINTYSSGKAARLATYAARCIENEILMSMRASKKNSSEVSINLPIGTDKDGNEISLNDILGTEPDAVACDISTRLQGPHRQGKESHHLQIRSAWRCSPYSTGGGRPSPYKQILRFTYRKESAGKAQKCSGVPVKPPMPAQVCCSFPTCANTRQFLQIRVLRMMNRMSLLQRAP